MNALILDAQCTRFIPTLAARNRNQTISMEKIFSQPSNPKFGSEVTRNPKYFGRRLITNSCCIDCGATSSTFNCFYKSGINVINYRESQDPFLFSSPSHDTLNCAVSSFKKKTMKTAQLYKACGPQVLRFSVQQPCAGHTGYLLPHP